MHVYTTNTRILHRTHYTWTILRNEGSHHRIIWNTYGMFSHLAHRQETKMLLVNANRKCRGKLITKIRSVWRSYVIQGQVHENWWSRVPDSFEQSNTAGRPSNSNNAALGAVSFQLYILPVSISCARHFILPDVHTCNNFLSTEGHYIRMAW